ncbi:MAG: hypothetical protein AB1635_20165 [Acidobacteriota bacterium]
MEVSAMRRYVFAAMLAGVALIGAGTVPAQDYPHAFPRTGATLLFENDRIILWEVNWIHGVKQPIHRHRYDMAGVYLRFGPITVTTPDGKAASGQPFEVPRPYFQVKGITHREEAMGQPGDPERLAIMIDLKDGPAPRPLAPGGPPPQFPRPGATKVLENERVRMWDYTWTDQATEFHTHDTDTVEVFFTPGAIRATTPRGGQEVSPVLFKTARFVARGKVDREEAIQGTPRAIIVELLR